jgi:uncharacterized protein YdaU (DUF1376 family)
VKNPWLAWYPGDYISKTRHLSMAQHGAYTLLLWEYYINGPIKARDQHVLNICSARAKHERSDVDFVLGEFFVFDGEFYRHKRADEERTRMEDIRNKRVKAGKARSACAQHVLTQPQPQLQPQDKSKSLGKRAKRLPEDFIPSEEHYALGKELGINTEMEFQKFRDYFLGLAGSRGVKLDWDATLRNWLRNSLNYKGVSNDRNKTPAQLRDERFDAMAKRALGEAADPENESGPVFKGTY